MTPEAATLRQPVPRPVPFSRLPHPNPGAGDKVGHEVNALAGLLWDYAFFNQLGAVGAEAYFAGAAGSRPASEGGKPVLTNAPWSSDHGGGNTGRVPLRTAVEGWPREARERGTCRPASSSLVRRRPSSLVSSPAPSHVLPRVL